MSPDCWLTDLVSQPQKELENELMGYQASSSAADTNTNLDGTDCLGSIVLCMLCVCVCEREREKETDK